MTAETNPLDIQAQPQSNLMDYETFRKLNESINAVVLNTASILEGYDKLDAKNITEHLEKIRSEALKIAGDPITQEKVQEIMTTIDTALNNALRRLEESGGVDMNAIKQELRADLERVKTELETSAQAIQTQLQTSLDRANEQIQAVAGAKDAILQEVTDKLKKIVESVGSGSKADYDEIVGDRDIEIELLHGASHNQPASTLSFLDWAEYVTLDKSTGRRRYLKIKGFGRDRSIIQHKREGEIYYYDILANIKEPIIKVIPLNGNYMLVCQDNNYVYMLGLDWEMLGAFQDIANPMGAVRMYFDSPVVTAHCTGDTTYVLLENGDLWASGRNPYTFGHNNNIDSYNAWTKTAFTNIKAMEYVADRSLDNRNGIAVLDSENNICSVGGAGRHLLYALTSYKANQPTIHKNSGYDRVWCLADAVIALKQDNTYGIGLTTGKGSGGFSALATELKAQKVLQDKEKTLYLLENKQLFYATGAKYYASQYNSAYSRYQYDAQRDTIGTNTYGNGVNSDTTMTPTKIFDGIEDMATYYNRWIIKKEDKTLWSWGLDAEKFAGISALSGTRHTAFKIFEGADDFVCGKNFTAVLKGKTISVSRELIIGNGFAEIYTAPTTPKKETAETEQTEQQTQEGSEA